MPFNLQAIPSSRPFRIFNVLCGAITFCAGAIMIIAAGAALITDMKQPLPVAPVDEDGDPKTQSRTTGPNTWYIMLICLGVFIMFFGCVALSCGLDSSYYRVMIKGPPTSSMYIPQMIAPTNLAYTYAGRPVPTANIWQGYATEKNANMENYIPRKV